MKKIFYLLVVSAIVFSSCASSSASDQNASDQGQKASSNTGRFPDFVLNPPKSEGLIYGVGAYTLSDDNLNDALAFAESAARASIAKAVSSKVSAKVNHFFETAKAKGINQDKAAGIKTTFDQNITKELATMQLKSTETVKREEKNGNLFVLISYDAKKAAEEADAVLSASSVLGADYATLKAEKAFDGLSEDLSKNDGLADNVVER